LPAVLIESVFVAATLLLVPLPSSAGVNFDLRTGSVDSFSKLVFSAEGTAENQLMTNIPASFAGADVGVVVGASTFYSHGITGQGTKVANVEGGHIWNGHETLAHVAGYVHDASAWNDPGTIGDQQSDLYDRHATWVGMVLAGRNAALPGVHKTGIASGATLLSGAIAAGWNGNGYSQRFSFNANSLLMPYATFFGNTDVINSSWGITDPPGIAPITVAADGLADANSNTTFVANAGNAGPASNSVGTPGSGYNVITVGALENDGGNRYDVVAAFSGRGPQSYGDPVHGAIPGVRAVVDIVAPGSNLTTAYYGAPTGGNNPTLPGSPDGPPGTPSFYSSVSGTSVAAPIVAGGAALIDSASYNTPALAANSASRDARVVKAVLLNSARKIPGWNNGQVAHPNGNGGVFTDQSLDYTSGAGALDLARAYDQYLSGGTRDVVGTPAGTQGIVDSLGWDFGIVQSGVDNVYQIGQALAGGSNFTITLDWFRDRSFNPLTFSMVDNGQVNLDLRLRDIISGNFISESVSTYNVVEHLHFQIPRTSMYQIEVRFTDNIFGSASSEEYGLAWNGIVVPEPASWSVFALSIISLLNARRRYSRSCCHIS
jgi:subtilisin family serine protease